MSKQATIASLVRTAAKSESEFAATIIEVFSDGDAERIAEFFDRLNIPRSTGSEDGGLLGPMPSLTVDGTMNVYGFDEEVAIGKGIQRFLDRHERKIKWHATHPTLEGTDNVLLLFRACMSTTTLRLARLRKLLASRTELTPLEWSQARRLMNKAYLSFRNFLELVTDQWLEAMKGSFEPAELGSRLGSFYELVDGHVQSLEKHKDELEEKRRELAVIPEGYPPVKPPVYFHGDLLGKGPWKLYWTTINGRAHSFREAVG
jgi:hypothetical protein